MTLGELADLGELIGSLGVIVSLLMSRSLRTKLGAAA